VILSFEELGKYGCILKYAKDDVKLGAIFELGISITEIEKEML
jgi:hypothetical protein